VPRREKRALALPRIRAKDCQPSSLKETNSMQRAILAHAAAPRAKATNYPATFAARMAGRLKRPLGDPFGLKNFGVNLTTLAPGAASALFHRHSRQDEFIYLLEGSLVLVTEAGEEVLKPGMCVGFPAGGEAHHLINRSDSEATYLEIGDRSAGDAVSYPNDDLVAALGPERQWIFTHKDGTPY
jgi:uncharacterized cupin superfamily protein